MRQFYYSCQCTTSFLNWKYLSEFLCLLYLFTKSLSLNKVKIAIQKFWYIFLTEKRTKLATLIFCEEDKKDRDRFHFAFVREEQKLEWLRFDVAIKMLFHLFFGRCLFMWRAKWSERANDLSHTLHLKGFAPVCFRKWRVSSSERAKRQSHLSQEHMYGFSPGNRKITEN